ncbi:PAS domain S-box-containing protein [Roseivirga pacifica]|uniref:histidine kinase n=2 Tax=Roseivirga pacifica TaxID=1267423 RepID=A0A1I0R079_9BACT|nr:PAS domain S-box protein [Roseivirga pacifica]RKQ42343.1 PAS domain S-box-containing protein [Roseivirga pacifica]SEW32851.1 PAS domain S-box-containing protein [Roseivirga pacifica]
MKLIRLLHVECDQKSAESFSVSLDKIVSMEFEHVQVDSLEMAQRAMETASFDVVFFNVEQQCNEGVHGISELKSLNASLNIIAIVNEENFDKGNEAIRLGAQDYLVTQELTPYAISKSILCAAERRALYNKLDEQKNELLKLSLAIEQSTNAIIITNRASEILYVNKYFEKLMGYSRVEIVNSPVRMLTAEENAKELVEEIIGVVSSGGVWKKTIRNRRKNGTQLWMKTKVSGIKDELGKVIYYLLSSEDVTEKRRQEEEILAQKSRLETAQRISSLGYWEYYFEDDEYFWSEQLYDLLEYPVDEGLPSFSSVVFEEDATYVAEQFERLKSKPGKARLEHRVYTGKGKVKFVESYWECFADDSGKPCRLLGVLHDITPLQESQSALQSTVEKLREVQRVARFGAWNWNVGEEFGEWSEELYGLFQTTPDKHKPTFDAWMSFIHAEDKARVMAELEGAMKSRNQKLADYRIVVGSGKLLYVEDNWKIVRDKNGAPTRIYGVIHDVTERKLLELERQQSSEKLRAIVASLDDHLFVIDAENRFKEFFVGSDKSILLTDPAEFIGKRVSQVLPPEVASQLVKAVGGLKETGDIQSFDYELEINDQLMWFNCRLTPLKPEGPFEGVTALVRNITEMKKAALALAESEERFKIQSEFLPHILWTADNRGQIKYINGRGRDFYGTDVSKVVNGDWDGIIHPDDREKSERLWNDAIKGKKSYEITERHKNSDGEYKWLTVTANPLLDKNKEVIYWIGTSTDVDAKVRARVENQDLVKKLDARVREAACLYKIAHLTQTDITTLDELLEKVVQIIPSGFENEKETFARIDYKKKVYENKPHSFRNSITMELKIDNNVVGSVKVSAPTKSEDGNRITFNRIEVNMLRTIQENIVLLIRNFEGTKEIIENEKRLSAIFDNAVVGIGLLKMGKFIECNATMLDLFKLDRKEFIGKRPVSLSPKYQVDGRESAKLFGQYMNDLEEMHSMHFGWQFHTRGAGVIEAEIHLSTVVIKNEPVAMIFVRDVTDEKAAQQALRASEEEYRNIFQNMQEGYMLRDFDGNMLSLNPAGANILGFDSAEDAVGVKIQDYIVDQEEVVRSNDLLMKDGVVQESLVLIKTNKGDTKVLEFNKRLITNEAEPWLVESTFRDVTNGQQMKSYMESSIRLYEYADLGYDELCRVGMTELMSMTNSKKVGFYENRNADPVASIRVLNVDHGQLEIIGTGAYGKGGGLKSFPKALSKPRIINDKAKAPVALQNMLATGYSEYERMLYVPIFEHAKVCGFISITDKGSNYTELEKELVVNYVNLFYSLLTKNAIKQAHEEALDVLEQSQQVGRLGAWRYDFDKDEIWWSDMMYEIFGLTKGRTIPKKEFLAYVYPEDREEVERKVLEIGKEGSFEQEHRIVNTLGEIRYLFVRAKLIREAGKKGVVLGVSQDITETKLNQLLIREKSEQFQNIVESLPGVVFRLELPSVKMRYVSDSYEEMFGYKKEEILRKCSKDYLKKIVHPQDYELVRAKLAEIVANKTSFTLTMRMVTRKGDVMWTFNKGKVVRQENGRVILEGFVYDVTERVKSEERIINAMMEASDAEKARISKEIHDSLQQTLTIASLNLEFVKREKGVLSERVQAKLETGWEYLKKSLNDSRGIAHRLMPKAIEDFGLVPVLQDLVSDLSASGDVEFEFVTNMREHRLKIPIENNLYKMVQEATNNILKHAKASSVVIQYLKTGDTIQLTVEDDGVGFSEVNTIDADSGFGLASMKNRASNISASLYIDSQPGHGTTVMVEFPFSQEILLI